MFFRLKELVVSLDQVKSEHLSSGGLFKEIFEAADLYGVFEDLFGRDKFFRPCVQLKIDFDFDEDFITPVHRGFYSILFYFEEVYITWNCMVFIC